VKIGFENSTLVVNLSASLEKYFAKSDKCLNGKGCMKSPYMEMFWGCIMLITNLLRSMSAFPWPHKNRYFHFQETD